MPIARAGDIELSYERSGSGPPLLMVMGLSGTYLHWDETFLEDLRSDFEVIVYDHRGVGKSSRVNSSFEIADLAHDAAGLLEYLEIERADVLGFSMGGMVAQELTLARPELVRTLVLASTYCGGIGSQPARRATIERLSAAMATGDRAAALRVGWEINVSPEYMEDDDAYTRFTDIAERRRVAIPVVMEQMRAIAAHDTSARLGSIEAPTLVVHGTADGMVPVDNAEMIAGLIPGSRLELLEGSGHLFFWEEPERAADLVREHALGEHAALVGDQAEPA
jgi:pimeloyl-ACP methyl ester carboxylesterase